MPAWPFSSSVEATIHKTEILLVDARPSWILIYCVSIWRALQHEMEWNKSFAHSAGNKTNKFPSFSLLLSKGGCLFIFPRRRDEGEIPSPLILQRKFQSGWTRKWKKKKMSSRHIRNELFDARLVCFSCCCVCADGCSHRCCGRVNQDNSFSKYKYVLLRLFYTRRTRWLFQFSKCQFH